MKKLTPEQALNEYRERIIKSIIHWNSINDNGCNDPFWADGTNMNLVRNHIISAKRDILELCGEEHIDLPDEYFLPTPEEVDNNYMANKNQTERVNRLEKFGGKLSNNKTEYSDQMSIT